MCLCWKCVNIIIDNTICRDSSESDDHKDVVIVAVMTRLHYLLFSRLADTAIVIFQSRLKNNNSCVCKPRKQQVMQPSHHSNNDNILVIIALTGISTNCIVNDDIDTLPTQTH